MYIAGLYTLLRVNIESKRLRGWRRPSRRVFQSSKRSRRRRGDTLEMRVRRAVASTIGLEMGWIALEMA